MKIVRFYVAVIGLFVSAMYFIADRGAALAPSARLVVTARAEAAAHDAAWRQLAQNLRHPLTVLLLQVGVILLASRAVGAIARWNGQQTVVGEIAAGILLGPSAVGALFPAFSQFVFPAESLRTLHLLSQLGLAFFMFVVGMELDTRQLRKKGHDAVVVSHASIVVPYFLGMGLAYFTFLDMAPPGVGFLPFALFMGIALSITAFPVLARIIQERGLSGTPLGVLAITCAAADDVSAWCILTVVVAVARADHLGSAAITIGLAVLFAVFMLYVLRPLLERVHRRARGNEVDGAGVAGALGALLVAAYVAEVIGIHALFGAFLAGVAMPADAAFRERITARIKDVSVLLLLPIFFALTGLRTQIGLVSAGYLWALCAAVIALAAVGKVGGSAVAARLVGRSWRESLSIGVLMNTRGLMELIVLNIGYDLGILDPALFAILVIMALVTTLMTGPLLDLIDRVWRRELMAELPHELVRG